MSGEEQKAPDPPTQAIRRLASSSSAHQLTLGHRREVALLYVKGGPTTQQLERLH